MALERADEVKMAGIIRWPHMADVNGA